MKLSIQYNETIRKMIKYDDAAKENINECNPNSLQILDYKYGLLITGGSGSGKTYVLLNLMKQEDHNDYSIIDENFFIC